MSHSRHLAAILMADGKVGYLVQIVNFSDSAAYVMSGYTRDASGKWLSDDEVAIPVPR